MQDRGAREGSPEDCAGSADGPDVIGGIGRDSGKADAREGGAGDDAPARAVPVDDPGVAAVVPHGPDVISGMGENTCDPNVGEDGAGVDAPACAVPVFDQGSRGTEADRPDVVAGC